LVSDAFALMIGLAGGGGISSGLEATVRRGGKLLKVALGVAVLSSLLREAPMVCQLAEH
jgi:hypothetical protein